MTQPRPLTILYALHGFLGLPTDWDILSPAALCVDELIACDINSVASASQKMGLKEWSIRFNEFVEAERMGIPQRRILMGYSLGGRLAMHALLQNPTLWDCVVLISAHPGLHTQEEKEQRFESDSLWAQRFDTEAWDTLITDWNKLSVWGNSPLVFDRHEGHYSRRYLSETLRHWSLGKQENLALALAHLPIPILWIAGEHDTKYATLARSMAFAHAKSQVWIAGGAFHRVPWQQPDLFQQQVRQFLCEEHNVSYY